MKKIIVLTSLLFTMFNLQAQDDRKQPKPGPSPTVNVGKPVKFTLSNGLKVMVVENHKLPRVSFSLTIDNPPFVEGDKLGVDDLTSAMIGNGTQTISKEDFNEAIDFLGANISFSSNGAYGSGLSKNTEKILELMALGCLNPKFTQVELDKEKEQMIEGLKSNEKSVTAVARRIGNFLAFGKNHPSGEFVTVASINNVRLSDIHAHYKKYFLPKNAFLVIIGDVNIKEMKLLVKKHFETWTKGEVPVTSYIEPVNVPKLQIDFVDMPNAVQSEIELLNTVNLKMTDKDYFAAIIANQVLGGDFNSYLNMNLREAHAWTYGARSGISGSRYTTKFNASTQVRNMVTDSAVVEFIKEIKRIRTEKVSDETLKNVKAGFIGKFVMNVEKPETVAGYALRTATNKLPGNFYENYIKSINAVTPEQVMQAANKYFLVENMRIVIVGKASEVIPGLEKLNIPINYFDKFGNPTEKPVEKKADVTVKQIINKYIDAIGGEKAVKAVKTVSSTSSATVQGMNMILNKKSSSDGMLLVEMTAAGMTMMKQVINDKGGYMEQQGQKKVLEGEKLIEMKEDAHPFPELNFMNKAGVSVLPIQKFNDQDVYGIKNGDKTHFYDRNTGLKLGISATQEVGGKSITQTISFNDYREVNGIKMPYETIMNVGIDIKLTTSTIKINEGVTPADFK